MREIKYKIFDRKNKRMAQVERLEWQLVRGCSVAHVRGVYEDDKGDKCIFTASLPAFYKGEERYTVIEYAGLKDKNDREIYEGDIAQVYGHNNLIIRLGKHAYDTRDLLVGGLYREVYGFYIESKCGSWECNISVVLDELEVIGNIYEGDSN